MPYFTDAWLLSELHPEVWLYKLVLLATPGVQGHYFICSIWCVASRVYVSVLVVGRPAGYG